jgi:hypothetical protein
VRGMPPESFQAIHQRCEELVMATVAGATLQEIADIRLIAERLIVHAHALAASATNGGRRT